jgi:hypothetical protein
VCRRRAAANLRSAAIAHTHDRDVAELAKIHVRRGIQQPQRAVHLERRQAMAALEARGEHQLVDIPRGDVLLRAEYAGGMARCRERGGRERKAARCEDRGHRSAQRPNDLAAQALTLRLAAVVEQRNAARQMVEHQQRTWRYVVRVRRLSVGEAAARQALEVAHGVVGGVADQAAEQRHAGYRRQRPRRLRQGGAQGIQELNMGCGPRRIDAVDIQAGGVQPHLETIPESDERIACEPLAAFDAFQQEPRAKRRELQIRRDRRVEVGCDVEQ